VQGIVFDEYGTALPEAWPTLRPMIDQNNGFAIFIGTPRGKNHFYDIYETARGRPAWSSGASTTRMCLTTSSWL